MKVVHSVADLRAATAGANGDIGFVPTMGALHAGHAALISRSVAECAMTVVSVYVNPTQFDNASDLERYPLTLDADSALAAELGADIVFAPSYRDVYPDDFAYQIDESRFSTVLCGAHRKGHFTGVLTVVMKLLNIVRPDRAYFGEKDYQQYRLISGMVEAFFLDVEIVPCETVRESDGLALSSRNVNLNDADRRLAPTFHAELLSADDDSVVQQRLEEAGFRVDYIETHDDRRFGAARLGPAEQEVRLIDNVKITRKQ